MPGPFAKPPYRIAAEVAEELVAHLDLEVIGRLPSPEASAQLLRRLREAMAQSIAEDRRATQARAGFMPTEEEQHPELYRDAPPP